MTLLGFLLAILTLPTPAPWRVQQEPVRIVNGSPVLFRVSAPAAVKELAGSFLGQELSFRKGAACRCWYAIAGVGVNTKPGRYTLHLAGKGAAATPEMSFDSAVTVGAARYPSSTLKVAPGFVEPPKEELARIEQDQKDKHQAFASMQPEPLWAGPFQPPAEAEISGVFGSSRVYNGVKKSQHMGLDFRVGPGTAIHATNSGSVVLARPLYFEGNCVMIDHGQGLLTIYMHLSEFKVKEGEHVEAGQLLGLSGGTGRVTGPHLHFAVRWRGEYLNPATLLELKPPE